MRKIVRQAAPDTHC